MMHTVELKINGATVVVRAAYEPSRPTNTGMVLISVGPVTFGLWGPKERKDFIAALVEADARIDSVCREGNQHEPL